MIVNIDKNGPWVVDEELKATIEKEGIPGTILAEADPEHPMWSKDLRVLHMPTGKVNGYSCYFNLKDKVLTIFNGFYQEPLEHSLEEFKYIIEDHANSSYKYATV